MSESPYEAGWLRTGDLGYVADGELFVTGRSKELIVHLGRNYHPEDIEWAALRVSGVLPGSCVAFADPSGEEGAVVVAVESDVDDDLRARVRAGITNAIGPDAARGAHRRYGLASQGRERQDPAAGGT